MSGIKSSIWRKVIALLSVFALLLINVPICSAATVTVYHETFASGAGAAKVAGGAQLSAVTGNTFTGNDDGAALYVSNRKNNWDGADFKFSDLGLQNGKTYTITVTGYVAPDAAVPDGAQAYLQAVDSYSWINGANLTSGAAFTLTGAYTVDTSKDSALRVQSNDAGSTVPFMIGDITIKGEGSATTQTTVYHEAFTTPGAVSVAGGAQISAVSGKTFTGNDDGAALYVSNRANNWDGADFKFSSIGLQNGETYTIKVTGYVDPDATVPDGAQAYLQAVDSYSWINGANLTSGAAFTLTGTYTVDTSKDSAIRIQSNDAGSTVPFYIGDILITGQTTSGGNTGGDPTSPAAVKFTPITFEDQTAGGFTGRGGVETLDVTNEAAHNGSYSLKVTGRTQSWNGPSLNIDKYIDQGSEYTVTAWVKAISPASIQLSLSTQVGNGDGASYVNLQSQTVSTDSGWVQLQGKYRYNNTSSNYETIYVESSNATASFYIDDISFEKTGGSVSIQDLAPIKDAYKNFLIGDAISEEDLQGVRLQLLTKHCNVITEGNAMKPESLQPTKGNFVWTSGDGIFNKAKAAGLKVHGHVLVWHQQTPAWFNQNSDGTPLSRAEALENMTTHIKTVMEHYAGGVISWDVVNEAMNDNPSNPSDWKASLRQSPWYKAIGDDFIEQAFLTARQELDAHPDWGNIRLFYNDYNEDNQAKATAIYNMVKDLNDKYALTHPGKLLIDGIGMQAHYMLSTNPTNVKATLEKYASLGVKVAISELDIQAGSNSTLTDKQAKAQGYLYAQIMDIFKSHASDIERVTFWGLDDGTSWRATSSPTLFDSDLQAKKAYYGVIDPTKYMAENPPEAQQAPNESKAIYGTPVIDGTVDAIWNNAPEMQLNRFQMAWQGASGTAKALWDDKYLYVLAQVNDAQLDKSSANAYEQDSVEAFVDQNNGKTPSYESDDGQYRVNYDNEASFNPGSIANGFVSATKVFGTNYTVEMKIPLTSITPKNGDKIGFDAQINDAKDGARQSVAAWNDTSGTGYQDTSIYGVLTLTGKGAAALSPSEIKVNAASPSNITIDIGENSLYSIKNGEGTLVPSVDYTVSGNKVTISKWYLGYYFTKFPDHNLYLDFNFTNGTSSRLTVYTGTSSHVVMTDAVSYVLNSGDVQLSLVLNGNFPTSVKNGEESLIPRIDYTYAPSTQIFYIRKGYLNTYFSKTSEPLKLTVNFTGDVKTVVISLVK